MDCLHHQASLGALDLLKVQDLMLSRLVKKLEPDTKPVKYCSSLMKIMNCRGGHAGDMFHIWIELDSDSARFRSTMPPKLIPSRWGSMNEREELSLKVPRQTFVTAARLRLDKRTGQQHKKRKQGDVADN
eukprot:777735-Pyramimonas_sp.AAC.1